VSLRALWTFLAIALPALASILAPMSTVDLTYHLRAGREILTTGAIPTVDTWTFTAAGTPWFDQQWGAQVVLRLVEVMGSWTGLVVLRAALTASIVGCVLIIARRRGLDVRRAGLLTVGAFVVAAPAMALRPQLLGMACFALTLLAVSERRRIPYVLWIVPIVAAVWANVHGSFFLAPVVLGLAWLEDLHDHRPASVRTAAAAVVSAAAACLTPFGPAVWGYVAGLSSNAEVTSQVTEWQPTSLHDVPGILFFGSALLVAVFLRGRGGRAPWPTLLWLGAFFAVGAYAQRGIAWWPFAAAAAIVPLLQPRPQAAKVDPPLIRRLNTALVVALVAAGIALLPFWRPLDPGTRTPVGLLTDAPSAVTAALRQVVRPGDRIFNAQAWGSWLEYAFPEATVAVDSRVEFFPPAVWRDYERVMRGEGDVPADLLDRGVRFVAVEAGAPLDTIRLASAGWTLVRTDLDGSVLVRQ
jgi:hypothetical protein